MKSFETQKHLHPIKGEGKQEKKKCCDNRNWDLVLCNNLVSKLLQPRQIQNQKQKRRLSDSLVSPIYLTATISSPSWISFLPTWELLISPSQLRRKVLQYNFSKKHGIRKEEINKLRISGRLIQWNSNNFFFLFGNSHFCQKPFYWSKFPDHVFSYIKWSTY